MAVILLELPVQHLAPCGLPRPMQGSCSLPTMSPQVPFRGRVRLDLLLRLGLHTCSPESGQKDGEHAHQVFLGDGSDQKFKERD